MQQNLLALAGLALVAGLILSGCSSVTPAGLMAASRLDPLNTPPTDITVAVGVPDSVRLSDGDAQLYLGFMGGSAASTVLVEETAPLQVGPAPDGAIRPNRPDEAIYLARLAPEDAVRIAEAQAEIKALRGRGIDGQGTLSIAVTGGCRIGAPLEALPVSTWLQTSPQDGFVRLTRQQDVFRALDEGNRAALQAELTPCPS